MTTDDLRILMCPPDHYDVDYVINPWMEGNVHRSSQAAAAEQWHQLHHIIKEHAVVDLVPPEKGWPDMVLISFCKASLNAITLTSSLSIAR
jgi:N-dimethylarginine dimethylaminohydrolase